MPTTRRLRIRFHPFCAPPSRLIRISCACNRCIFRAKEPGSLRKKLEDCGIAGTTSLEKEIKDLAGCRLIFYTNSDVAGFLQSGIIQDNFDVDWERTKIHHPVPRQTEPGNLFISNNYVAKLKADCTGLAEYARFAGLWCEVQVQTTLNDAWSRNGARHHL